MDRKQFRLAGGGPSGNNRFNRWKNVGFIALIILFCLIVWSAFNQPSQLKDIPFSQVVNDANSGKIQKITIEGEELEVTLKGDSEPTQKSRKEPGSSIYEQGLEQGKTQVEVKPDSSGTNSVWGQLLISVLPVLIIAFILILMFRSAQGQGNQALSFGKSRARLYGNEKDRIDFKDVAGNDEAKQDLEEIVEFLKYPKKF